MLREPVVVFLHDNIGQQTVNIWDVMKVMVHVTPPNPPRFEALILIKSWDETDRVSPKTGHFPRLKALQIKPATKSTAGNPTTLRPHAGVHNSTGHTPGVLIPTHTKDSHADIQL